MPPATPIEAVGARLVATSALTMLIALRSYPDKPTQDAALPYVVFFKVSGGDGMRLAAKSGLQEFDVRAEAYGRNSAEAEAVFEAMKNQLAGWSDRPNGVQGCFPRGDADAETLEDGGQVMGQSFAVWFKPQ